MCCKVVWLWKCKYTLMWRWTSFEALLPGWKNQNILDIVQRKIFQMELGLFTYVFTLNHIVRIETVRPVQWNPKPPDSGSNMRGPFQSIQLSRRTLQQETKWYPLCYFFKTNLPVCFTTICLSPSNVFISLLFHHQLHAVSCT